MPRYDIARQDSSLIPFYRIFIYIIKNKFYIRRYIPCKNDKSINPQV
ncbi:hypothetical protein HMPREF0860_2070 [Treponema socranskii subsp. socranskii VPI DR56BR1116 = ATCC 35536]|uniref:Uncharacterized protein n=1 Tax=Treponema socranskii subsp. socranskii VPI DR56BR1116 = ATCC 35536 TaxID=1125725 RepID=A0ABP2YLZ0_TRESO|nr:hypothetical protein HMPREF0860_2070 [Treponema socranskii subsp. socranskii VPI DR56BR1116 = ATCC 35536]